MSLWKREKERHVEEDRGIDERSKGRKDMLTSPLDGNALLAEHVRPGSPCVYAISILRLAPIRRLV